MTQKMKLEIIGPYTPDHEGPFCTRGGLPVRVLCTDVKGTWPIVVAVLLDSGKEAIDCYAENGRSSSGEQSYRDLMCAREVPVVRDFWVNEYVFGEFSVYTSEDDAKAQEDAKSYVRTIHVREVLPGEVE